MINITGSLKSIDECYFPYTEGNESLVEAAFEERVTRQVKAISDQVVGPADRSLHVVYWPFSEYEGEKGELPIGQFCTNPIPSRKCEREA
jgi:hypothetical protein